jgi:hypothetical protein
MNNPHDLNSDQIRRELRTLDQLNETATRRWRSALTQLFSGDVQMSTDEKAALLGVPSPGRRDLFKMGGISILGAAVLAACGSSSSTSATDAATTVGTVPETTPPVTDPAPTGPPPTDAPQATDPPATDAAAPNQDIVLAKTAASLEQLAVDTYGKAAGLIQTPAVLDAAKMFAGHHQMHLDALNAVISGAGDKPITQMNQAVYDALVAPALGAAKTEADAVMLALALEEAAAQTYAFAGGALSTAALRSTIMTIGGVEARHAAVLRVAALAQSPLDVFASERAFFPGANPLAGIDGALITT